MVEFIECRSGRYTGNYSGNRAGNSASTYKYCVVIRLACPKLPISIAEERVATTADHLWLVAHVKSNLSAASGVG